MCIAFFAALITSFIVPIDATYLEYFDVKTLTCLFCVLAVVCALKNINFFYMLARKVVQYTHLHKEFCHIIHIEQMVNKTDVDFVENMYL